jgi:DNA gyrase/topoisomerase IV subunit B
MTKNERTGSNVTIRILWYMRKDKNVFDYTDDKITVNYDDRSRVRQSPQVYLPSTDLEGAIHTFDEALANDIDEVLAPDSCGTEIIVTIDEKTGIITMQDDGRGIPLGKIFDLCEVLSSSGKMGTKNRAYNHSTGAFGMGMKLINFFSVYMKIKTEREGKFIEILYEDGLRKEVKQGKSKHTGTYLEWKVDKRFFSNVNITTDHILDRIKKKSYVAGKCIIIFNGKKKTGEEITKEFKNGKLKDFIAQYKISSPIADFKQQVGNTSVEFVFGYDVETEEGLEVIGFTNGSYNKIGGSHVNGLIEGISSFMRKYMMESYISEKEKKDKDFKIVVDDIKQGLVGIVSIYAFNPNYKGQYKEGLEDTNLKNFVYNAVRKYLRESDKTTLNKFAHNIKRNIAIRMAAESTKKRTKKDITNAFSENKIDEYLPISKYSTSKFKEMCIVEGLSAKGGFKAVRNKDEMAVLAIRGKVENVFDLTPAEAYKKSQFIRHIVHIYECENDNIKNFDITKLEVKRVNIVTDADTDGDEISSQIAMIYAKFFPSIVTSGRLYKVVPPLYEITVKGKKMFIPTVRDYVTFTRESFNKAHKLHLYGKEIKNDDLLDFLVEFHEYKTNLEYLSAQYILTPELTEFFISNLHVGFENAKMDMWNGKILPASYRFLKAIPGDNGYLQIEGMVGSEYNIFEFTEEFIEDIIERYQINPDAHFYGYTIDNNSMSLYEIMKEVSKYAPKIETRFKGLGEMPSADVERTIVDRKARHSIRLTMKDIEDSYEKIAVMHSKKPIYSEQRKLFMRNLKFNIMTDIDT